MPIKSKNLKINYEENFLRKKKTMILDERSRKNRPIRVCPLRPNLDTPNNIMKIFQN